MTEKAALRTEDGEVKIKKSYLQNQTIGIGQSHSKRERLEKVLFPHPQDEQVAY